MSCHTDPLKAAIEALPTLIHNYGRACRRDGNPAWESTEGQALKAVLDALTAAQSAPQGEQEPKIEKVDGSVSTP